MRGGPGMKKKPTTEAPGQITVGCTGSELVLIENLVPFQGKFKGMTNIDKGRLRRQLVREGITAAATVWKHRVGGKVVLSLLDGHQRHDVLMTLQKEGWRVPPIPVNFTECANEAAARRTVMALASTYGKVNQDELVTFAGLAELNLPDLDKDKEFSFPDIDLAEIIRSGGTQSTEDQKYTKKVSIPIYTITGEKPKIQELVDQTKANELIKNIKKADISEDEKVFLIKAAGRHHVFDYRKIAEFYAHAPKKVQVLMEDSALVIIDFNKAIEKGFVIMSKGLDEIFDETYGENDGHEK